MARYSTSKSRARRTALMVVLESFPPAFNFGLISGLAYLIYKHRDTHRDTFGLFAGFVVLQIFLNWVQFLRHRSMVPISTRNFPGYVHRFPSLTTPTTERSKLISEDDLESLKASWKECESCDMHVPIISHHCSHCRKCIYALDHHCYFLGHCVGRANHGYFIVFCLYAALGSALGVWNIFDIMSGHRNALSQELAYYLLPFTSLMYLMGSAQAWEVAYVGLMDFGVGAFTATAFFFWHGLHKALHGDPRHQKVLKKEATRNEFTHIVKIRYDDEEQTQPTKWDRFRQIFGGNLGFLHFLFPFLPNLGPLAVYPSVVEDGYRRIVTYNNDYISDGMVHTSEDLLS